MEKRQNLLQLIDISHNNEETELTLKKPGAIILYLKLTLFFLCNLIHVVYCLINIQKKLMIIY